MPSERLIVDSDYTVRDQERMADAENYFEWQAGITKCQLGRRVLEIGCGVGNFTRHLVDRELVAGIDVDADCIAKAKDRFRDCGNIVHRHLDVMDEAFGTLRAHNFDSVVCLNVLEHVQDDQLALANMASILPVGGKVVLLVPAFSGLYGPIDRHLGHYRRYSKRSLRETAMKSGFVAEKLRYMNFIGFFGWWCNARIFKKQEQSSGQIAIFDRLIVPIQSRIENAMSPPFGQSLFAVLVKATE